MALLQTQFQHELRKKEREFTKLQEHLNALLLEKRTEKMKKDAIDAAATTKGGCAKDAGCARACVGVVSLGLPIGP